MKVAHPQLKLLHAGLLVIAVTLVVELVYLGSFTWFLDVADRRVDAISRPFRFAAKASETIKLFYKCSSMIFSMGYTKDASLDQVYQQGVKSLSSQTRELSKLIESTPGTSKQLSREVQVLGETAVANLQESRDLLGASGTPSPFKLLETQRVVNNAKDVFERYLYHLSRAISSDAKSREKQLRDEQSSRQTIKFMIVTGFLLNAALPLVAVFFWIKGVTGRIDVLSENARRLQKGTQLLPLRGGHDEIADLERTFHGAHQKLKETEELKREFAKLLSQELRNPLKVINETLVLGEGGGFPEVNDLGRKRFKRAALSSRRLLSMINDLVDLYDMEAGKFHVDIRDADLKEVLQIAVDEVTPLTLEKSVRIDVSISADRARCDPDRIAQVVINFLSNAIKYSPKDASISLSSVEVDGSIEIRVTDQGTGIPEEFKEKLFARYEQSETAVGGTGLGLFICKSILDQHSGTIGAGNIAGAGASFWCRFPV
jgi:signal transduction histidine kinase